MKKIIYSLLFSVTLIACVSTTSTWNREQRRTIHRTLDQYRDMVYMDELTDAEFYIFADNATDIIEMNYPQYEEFVAMPAVNDSIQMVVTTIIVEQLDADGANIRHIYPYRELRKEGILPKALTRKEQRSFYKCLARKINAQYSNFATFLDAVIANTTDAGKIAEFQSDCAKTLFGWEKTPPTEKK
ncbi:MAG: hypothetical protein SNF68_05270 [Rikenellaceae bacterium]